jgi:hypothetical protein
MEQVAIAGQKDNIWIPPNGRPYWTTHNSRGNAGPHLTNRELKRHGLLEWKKHSFDEGWYWQCTRRSRTRWERFVDRYFYWV